MIQFDSLRKDIDPPFKTLVAELDVAYYQFWKKGLSRPWHGFDVQATPELSHALFDKLHGAVWNAHAIAMKAENEKRGFPYEDDKIDIPDESGAKTSIKYKNMLKDLRTKGVDIPAILAARGVTIAVD